MNLLLCAKCGTTRPLPTHCGKPMKVQQVGGKSQLVCWMGTSCAVQELPKHCEVTMGISQADEG